MSVEVCRLCCKSDNVLLQVFDNVNEEIALATKIYVCFGVQVKEDDSISKGICKSCYYFTNSAYEYRISAQQNDVKLKQAYEDSLIKTKTICYPPVDISQDDFLNTFNLANKNKLKSKSKVLPEFHTSVKQLKRKYPEINIPPSCNRINIDPVVSLDTNAINNWCETLNLEIWAVNQKKFKNQNGVTLTRIKPGKSVEDVDKCYSSNERSLPIKKKKKKADLWSSPTYKSLRITSRKKNFKKSSPNKQSKTAKLPDKKEEENEKKKVDSGDEMLPRITRSISRAGKLFEEMEKCEVESDKLVESNEDSAVDSDNGEEIPPLEDIIKNSQFKIINEKTDDEIAPEQNSSKQIISEENTMEEITEQTYLKETLSKLPAYEDDSEFPSTSNDDNNLLMSIGEEMETYICQTCNKVFDTQTLLNKHKKSNHSVLSLHCLYCSKRFPVVENLLEHIYNAHSNIKEPITKSCDTSTSDETSVRENTLNKVLSNDNSSKVIPIESPMPNTGSVTGCSSVGANDQCQLESPSPILELPENHVKSQSSNNSASRLSEITVPKALSKHVPPILKRVARKSTTLSKQTSKKQTQPRINMKEYVISSDDDDIEITNITQKIPVMRLDKGNIKIVKTRKALDKDATCLDQVNQASDVTVTQTSSENNIVDNSVGHLVELQTSTEPNKNLKKSTDVSNVAINVNVDNDQVLLIVESDPEDDSVVIVPNDVSVLPKAKGPKAAPSTSAPESTVKSNALDDISKQQGTEIMQRIIMVPNAQEKRNTNNSAISNAKITNEDNYINYIFNKCRYEGKSALTEKKWFLKDLRQLLKKNYIRVEVELSNVNTVHSSYVVPPVPQKQPNASAYWNCEQAIVLPANKPTTKNIDKSKLSEVDNAVRKNPGNLAAKVTEVPILPKASGSRFPHNGMISIPPNVTVPFSSNLSVQPHSNAPIQPNSNIPMQSSMMPVNYTTKPLPLMRAPPTTSNTNINLTQNQLATASGGQHDPFNLFYILDRAQSSENIDLNLRSANTVAPPTMENYAPVTEPNELNQIITGIPGLTNTQQKPILLNGMSYPNFVKLRYDTPQIYVHQVLQQPTNVNIQNYVSMNQSNIPTRTETAPMVRAPDPGRLPMLLSAPEPNQSNLVPKEPTMRPSIRIKNLSELTRQPVNNIEERNFLHGFYSNTVTSCVNTTTMSSIHASNISDNYNNTDRYRHIS